MYDEGQTKSNKRIKSTSYTDTAQKLAQAFTTRVSHFSVDLTPEKAKQSSEDMDEMFLEYVCLRLWEGKFILVLFGNNNLT